MNEPSQTPLFVVGFARSGTSLLYSMLNLHPKIRLLYEPDLLSHTLVACAALSGRNWWERLDFFNSTMSRHRLTHEASWERVRCAQDAAKILYHAYGGEARYIGEKSPRYYNCLPMIAQQFAGARFIIIWRSPHSTISSIISAGKTHYFFSNRSFPLRAVVGFEQMQADVLKLRAEGIPIFDLCYEDLAAEPEPLLQSICSFLEIPFDPRMLQLDQADYSMFPPGEHHDKVKSGHLTKSDRTKEPLANPIEEKIPRYLARWKKLFGDKLATKRYWAQASVEEPPPSEVLRDHLDYKQAVIFAEQITPFLYGFFPLRLLQAYRAWRGKNFAPSSSSPSEMPWTTSGRLPKISVVTPSYKQLPWLKLCVASVNDQKGVEVEHIIQDAQTGPELDEWVREHSKAQLYVECDSGMYDAINRGFARATGDIVCWLNSDEQYLEGTLATVARFFEKHPEIDVLFGDALLAGNTGDLLSYRRTVAPKVGHIRASHLNVLSCATFVRRSVLDRGFKLDIRWKTIADAVWIAELLEAHIPMAVMNEPLSVFTITDKNLGQTSLAASEIKLWRRETMSAALWQRPFYVMEHRITKLLNLAYWPRTVSIRLYTLASPNQRVSKEERHIGFRWPKAE